MEAINLKRFLFQPYSYNYTQTDLRRIAPAVFLICFAFIYFFEPFLVYKPEHKFHFFWISLVHSALPVTIGYSYFSILNLSNSGDNWTIGKEILHISLALFLIGTGNFLIRDLIYNNPDNWSFSYFWEEITHAFLVGALIAAIFIPMNFNRLLKKFKAEANELNLSIESQPARVKLGNTSLPIKTQVKSDEFDLQVSDFLFAKAAGNYVEIFTSNGQGVKKQLKRVSIKSLEEQLSIIPGVFKTHRAYLVNLHKIKEVNGNAQGYQLSFLESDEKAPVSRGIINTFNAAIKKNSQ